MLSWGFPAGKCDSECQVHVFKLFCFKCQGCLPVTSTGLIKAVREIENRNEIKYDIWKNRAGDYENSHPSMGKEWHLS